MSDLITVIALSGSVILLAWYQGHHKRTADSLQNQINLLQDRVSILEQDVKDLLRRRYDRWQP